MTKLMRVTTVPVSLRAFCSGLVRELKQEGYDVVAVSSPGKELDEFGQVEGVRVIGVPMKRRISPLNDLVSLWRMWRVMRRERPDIVHSMTPKAGMTTSCLACTCASAHPHVHRVGFPNINRSETTHPHGHRLVDVRLRHTCYPRG